MNNNFKILEPAGYNSWQPVNENYVSIMDTVSNTIVKKATRSRKRTNPILSIDEQPIIYPRTINVIQGRSGTHKSRVAEA
ncbi:MAG: hypothetical protein RLZ10_604, partial [Bacteroidota bacterium]